MSVAKKGKVVMVNHQRLFGFIEEEVTNDQVFFHFNDYAPHFFDFGDGVVIASAVGSHLPTYPRKGDILYYHSALGRKGRRTISWVYEVQHIAAETEKLKKEILELRTKPPYSGSDPFRSRSTNDTRYSPPPPPPPPPRQPQTPLPWRVVLAIPWGTTITRKIVTSQYRKLAFDRHPDRGGSHQAMADLNRARDEALRFVTV